MIAYRAHFPELIEHDDFPNVCSLVQQCTTIINTRAGNLKALEVISDAEYRDRG